MPTIVRKIDTGQDDENGDRIFRFGKNVVAFRSTVPALTARRLRLLDRQQVLTSLVALVAAGEDISDLVGTSGGGDVAARLAAVTATLAEVDEALAL